METVEKVEREREEKYGGKERVKEKGVQGERKEKVC